MNSLFNVIVNFDVYIVVCGKMVIIEKLFISKEEKWGLFTFILVIVNIIRFRIVDIIYI